MAADRITSKDRDRALKAADRAKLRELSAAVAAAKVALVAEHKNQLKARRTFLARLRKAHGALPGKRERTARAAKVRALAAERDRFRAWWSGVLAERDRRRASLASAKSELSDWRRLAPARRKAAKESLKTTASDQLEAFDEGQARAFESKASAVTRAKRALSTERADQKALKRNASDRKSAALKRSKTEKTSEFTGGVESNLDGALEFVVWKRARSQILAQAKRQNVSTADGVAELVREYVEANEERATEWLANDVDSWVQAEWARHQSAA